tara:strand:+ start:59 stop:907 length:849 start_codon:yes stop_codon:yes gene_type:complete
MIVFSGFDGMSCAQIALNKLGVNPTKYYASEINEPAIKVTQANYPNTIQMGDITKWREWDLEWSNIDLIAGGSPCQGFSFAGKQLAFNDPRSALVFVWIDILNHIKSLNPNVKFMLENVKMKKCNLDVISQKLGVKPVFINSSDHSACARPRYYWMNYFTHPLDSINDDFYTEKLEGDLIKMSPGWNKWWLKNSAFQIKKSYSKIVREKEKGITMTARQYASWNGNFVEFNGSICKPGKKSLANLVGAPLSYFDCVSQRQTELMTGNGQTVDVIAHIFKGLL